MNDERFFDLAMKVIARQCTDAERSELDALLANKPALKAEFERLQADTRTAKHTLPLVDATQATTGEFTAYARGRLQSKLIVTLGRPVVEYLSVGTELPRMQSAVLLAPRRRSKQATGVVWRWLFGLAAATALILMIALPMLRTSKAPVIQLAMLDTAGATRGPDTNEAATFQTIWPTATLEWFSSVEVFRNWESQDKPNTVKLIYDRTAAEVRVFGKWRGKSLERTFVIEQDLATTLTKAKLFIGEQTKE